MKQKRGTYTGKIYQGKPCVHGHGTARYTAGGACVVCNRAKAKARYESGEKPRTTYNPEYSRRKQLKDKYGITPEDYARMEIEQAFGCAVCGGLPTGVHGKFHIDHDHDTGAVRSLLCMKCNVGIGSFDENPAKLRLAIAYLVSHGKGE